MGEVVGAVADVLQDHPPGGGLAPLVVSHSSDQPVTESEKERLMAQVASLTQSPFERISAAVRGQCSGRVVPVSRVVVSGSCAKKIPCSRTVTFELVLEVQRAGTWDRFRQRPPAEVDPEVCLGTVMSRWTSAEYQQTMSAPAAISRGRAAAR